MSNEIATQSPPDALQAQAAAPMAQVPEAELADLRRRADRYRFLFRTIVTVTSILVVGTLIVVAMGLLSDR
jgi:hypothetical protein